jgi:3-isopropylmalate/(R)-2-methylmalate dehydratase small subunit
VVTRIATVTGRGTPLRGNDIDTDRIIPARFLRSVTFDGLETHLFEDDRKAGGHPLDDPRFRGASILLVNANFGCGSSREHAPQAVQRCGFNAVLGESFAGIFFGNSLMIGLPCVTASTADVRTLMDLVEKDPHTQITLDIAAGTCKAGSFDCAISTPPNARDALLTGAWDTTGMLLDRFEEVQATAARLPYVSGFK